MLYTAVIILEVSVGAVCVYAVWSAKYPSEDIDTIINMYLKDPRPVPDLYDEMAEALDDFSKVSTYYCLSHCNSIAWDRLWNYSRLSVSQGVCRLSSVVAPTAAILIRFSWNFAQWFGAWKIRSSLFRVKIRWLLPPILARFFIPVMHFNG